jgi:hypothetical protein
VDPLSIVLAALALFAIKASEAVATEIGQATWNKIARLVRVVETRFRDDSTAQAALDRFDEAARAGRDAVSTYDDRIADLARTLRRCLKNDDQFRAELTRLAGDLAAERERTNELRTMTAAMQTVLTARFDQPSQPESDTTGGRQQALPPQPPGGPVTMHEAIIALRHIADEQLPDQLAAQLAEALDNTSAGLARQLGDGFPIPRLRRAYARIQDAKAKVEEAQGAIRGARQDITDLIALLGADVD